MTINLKLMMILAVGLVVTMVVEEDNTIFLFHLRVSRSVSVVSNWWWRVGVYLHFLMNIGGLLTTFACVRSIVWPSMTPAYEKKAGRLTASALFEGASIGPLIQQVIDVDLGAAILARRHEYLGGFPSSIISLLFWLSFIPYIFGGYVVVFKFELYFGLLVFMGYMVVDTRGIFYGCLPVQRIICSLLPGQHILQCICTEEQNSDTQQQASESNPTISSYTSRIQFCLHGFLWSYDGYGQPSIKIR